MKKKCKECGFGCPDTSRCLDHEDNYAPTEEEEIETATSSQEDASRDAGPYR